MTPEQVKIYRAMSAADKLKLAARLHYSSRSLKAAGLAALRPDLSKEEIRQKVRKSFLYAPT